MIYAIPHGEAMMRCDECLLKPEDCEGGDGSDAMCEPMACAVKWKRAAERLRDRLYECERDEECADCRVPRDDKNCEGCIMDWAFKEVP